MGTYNVGDVLKVAVEGGRANYYRNSDLVYTDPNPNATPIPYANYPFHVDTSILNLGGRVADAYMVGARPLPNNLCFPGALSIDHRGNLFVADNSLEADGNNRLLEFNGSLFQDPNQVIYAPNASKIFPGRASWEPAFDHNDRMVVGYNPYGPSAEYGYFPGIYNDPLASSSSTSQDGLLSDYYSEAFAATFDDSTNLYVADLDRARVLIYKHPGICKPVTWTNSGNVTIAGNSIKKTSGVEGQWDAGAVSGEAILSGDGYVSMTAEDTARSRIFGLSNDDENLFFDDVDFGIFVSNQSARLDIVEDGVTVRQGVASYVVGDSMSVAVEGGVVKYYKNDTLLYASTKTPKYPLLLDTSIGNMNGTVSNAYICGADLGSAVTWTNMVNVRFLRNSIWKNRGDNSLWDAGAVSNQAIYSGNGSVSMTADTIAYDRMFGLSNGDSGQDYTDIDYAIWATSGISQGRLDIFEYGQRVAFGVGQYIPGDILKVAIERGVVKYYKNNILLYTSTNARTPTFPLLLDTTILQLNGGVYNAHLSGNDVR